MTSLDVRASIAGERAAASRVPYAITIFLGAFLIFQIQPLMGKFIIPWYGGLPSAWTGCLIFFQGGLLAGYLYAHLLVRYLPPRAQAITHGLLLVACLPLLPIAPGSDWKPAPGTHSMGGIFQLLGASVGLPYLLLASTGPMLQAWFHRSFPDRSPYRLFALSNLGSMLALVSFPFVFEPWFSRTTLGWIWTAGFGVYLISCVLCGYWSLAPATGASAAAAAIPEVGRAPTLALRLLWVALAACASLLLLSVTNHLCQGLPSIPFLWVLPLSLYLLSFIVCFEWPKAYSRPVFLVAMFVSVAGVCWLLRSETESGTWLQIAGYSVALFVCCMVCHGELALSKPVPSHLTGFYLAVAAGGALGGAFVGLAAPHLFLGFFELHVGFFLCPLLVLVSHFTDSASPLYRGRPRWVWVMLAAAIVWLGVDLKQRHTDSMTYVTESYRDFFGVLKLFEGPAPVPPGKMRLLGHGGIIHGVQFIEPEQQRHAITSYFGPGTGFAETIQLLQRSKPLRVGVVGLGIGTIAAWGRPEDSFRFYEINPGVIRLAQERFTFLRDSASKVEIVEGDGRLALEAEPDQHFDLLVLDAFNGDSPPIHLLTAEAFAVYRRHLEDDGVLAVNVSNKFLDFEPVVRRLAETIGMSAIRLDSPYRPREWITPATWMLLSAKPEVLEPLASKATAAAGNGNGTALWTDDYANVLAILRR